MNNQAERIHWVDIAKGLLIILVVFHHIPQVAMSMGFDNKTWMDIDSLKYGYCCFFMASFFIITGYCSNFNKPFKSFAISSFKTIILPAIIIRSIMILFGLIKELPDINLLHVIKGLIITILTGGRLVSLFTVHFTNYLLVLQ